MRAMIVRKLRRMHTTIGGIIDGRAEALYEHRRQARGATTRGGA